MADVGNGEVVEVEVDMVIEITVGEVGEEEERGGGVVSALSTPMACGGRLCVGNVVTGSAASRAGRTASAGKRSWRACIWFVGVTGGG